MGMTAWTHPDFAALVDPFCGAKRVLCGAYTNITNRVEESGDSVLSLHP
jgi:hypothetical protein